MTKSSLIFYLSPSEIIVKDRQRSTLDNEKLEELKLSIQKRGQFTPILVRKENEKTILVYGHHRLEACKSLNIQVSAFYFENLSEIEAKIIELEENIKRSDLQWEDKVKAIAEIHNLHKKENEKWTPAQTASELSLSVTYIYQVLTVFPFLGTKKLEAALNFSHAHSILTRFADRKAGEIVSTLLGAGSGLFSEEKPKTNTLGTASTKGTPPTTVSSNSTKISSATGNGQTNTSTVSRSNILLQKSSEAAQNISAKADFSLNDLESEDKNLPTTTSSTETIPQEEVKQEPKKEIGPIIVANFIEWADSYSGEKFSLIHADFPYGVYHSANKHGTFGSTFDGTSNTQEGLYENNPKIYWELLESFVKNFNKFASNSCHCIFWFSFNFYNETITELEKTGLKVQPHPFIWHKTDSKGVSPWPYGPKRIYDSAFICSRGNRSMVKQGTNCFGAPTTTNKIHPSEKSQLMLEYFLSSYIDETTSVLDICSGSGVAIRAAENIGARKTLGLELSPDYAQEANASILKARHLKKRRI